MIDFLDAVKIIQDNIVVSSAECLPLGMVSGRVLAQDVVSRCDMPPFDKSAMDGFACRRADVLALGSGLSLEVVEVIPAGAFPGRVVGPGQCSKIMTGAPMPMGADMVIMVEECVVSGASGVGADVVGADVVGAVMGLREGADALKLASKGNVCLRGEDVRSGEVVLPKGLRLKAQDVAVVAACGWGEVLVYERVKVGVISTGSELVEAGGALGRGQIYNSNSWQIASLMEGLACDVCYYGIAVDDVEMTRGLLERAVDECDLVLLSGGVSEGDFDFVPVIMRGLGFEILFDRVAVQPGKPSTFAVRGEGCDRKYVFGLPGNPVSTFVQSLLMVRPLVLGIQGCDFKEKVVRLPLGEAVRRKNSSRMAHIPVRISRDGCVVPLNYHGSAHITALSQAEGLLRIPIGVSSIECGKVVEVIVL